MLWLPFPCDCRSNGAGGEALDRRCSRPDAEVALRQSEFNYAQAVYDFLVARAQLDQATGRVPMVDFEPAVTDGSGD